MGHFSNASLEYNWNDTKFLLDANWKNATVMRMHSYVLMSCINSECTLYVFYHENLNENIGRTHCSLFCTTKVFVLNASGYRMTHELFRCSETVGFVTKMFVLNILLNLVNCSFLIVLQGRREIASRMKHHQYFIEHSDGIIESIKDNNRSWSLQNCSLWTYFILSL